MDGPSMLHPGSPPPSWPQNEVKILIDSGTSPLMPLCGSAIGLAPIIFFKTDPWGHIPVFIFYANILYNGANIKRNKHTCSRTFKRGGPARALWSRRGSRCHARGFTRTRTHAAPCEPPWPALPPTGSPRSSDRPPMRAARIRRARRTDDQADS